MVQKVQLFLNKHYPEPGEILEDFTAFSKCATLEEIQELYTRSFEVQAITTLDLGYLLFGDDYKRAQLLVNLSREHREMSNDCGLELADHLPNVLRLLPLLKDEELRNDLSEKLVYSGLKKMTKEFNPGNLKKKNEVYIRHHKTLITISEQYGTIYQKPLLVLLLVIEQDFNIEIIPDKQPSDFLGSIETEMKIEG
jgi:nitrate reductase assembly molybdenum cofactor insertion protein NarJ